MENFNLEKINKIKINNLRKDLPEIKVGDKIEIETQIFSPEENNKRKTNLLKGTIIWLRRKNQDNFNFKVISESYKNVVKRIFFYNSPLIIRIKILGKVKNRRANLSYLEKIIENKSIIIYNLKT